MNICWSLCLAQTLAYKSFRLQEMKSWANLGASSSMKIWRGCTSDGLHLLNSWRQLCITLTGVTISAVFNPRSTLLITVYKKATTCMQIANMISSLFRPSKPKIVEKYFQNNAQYSTKIIPEKFYLTPSYELECNQDLYHQISPSSLIE